MNQFLSLLALSTAAVASAGPLARPFEILPHPTIYRMANVACAVVEGTVGDGDAVTITRRHFVAPGLELGERIDVRGLTHMPRQRPAVAIGGKLEVEPEVVLLFLEKRAANGAWVALHHLGNAARGVLWIDTGGKVFGYGQPINPGAYVLERWRCRDLLLRGVAAEADAKLVRDRIAQGLVGRASWQRTLAIVDPAERAAALAKWLSPDTSPDGAHWHERLWPDVMQACGELGAAMVRPLAQLLRAAGDPTAAGYAADALTRLDQVALHDAVPDVIARLRDPRGLAPIRLVRVLRRAADPRAAAVLRDHVGNGDLFVACEAAEALFASGGADAVELLRKRLPPGIDDAAQRGAVASMLVFLHEHDPERTEAVVVARYLDDDQLMMQRPWLRRLRDAHRDR